MSGDVHVRFCERLGVRFPRATHLQVYVKSEAAGERVIASLERFLEKRLRLKVNRERKFLGYRTTTHLKPKLRPAPESVKRLKLKLKDLFRRGRGWSLARTIRVPNPILRGWANYYRLAEVEGSSRSWTSGSADDCACCSGVSGSGHGHAPRSSRS